MPSSAPFWPQLFWGGSGRDLALSPALDGTGRVYVAGLTGSPDFPGINAGSADSAFGGELDLLETYVTKLDANLSAGPPQACEQQIVNDHVDFVVTRVALRLTPVPGGPAGTFTITTVLANTSAEDIQEPIKAVVDTLTNGNLLLSATEGMAGSGASRRSMPVPMPRSPPRGPSPSSSSSAWRGEGLFASSSISRAVWPLDPRHEGSEPMAHYRWHDLTLEVTQDGREPGAELAQLLDDLSCVRADDLGHGVSLHCAVHWHLQGPCVSRTAHEVFRADGFRGLEDGDDFYVTDGASLFHLQPSQGRGEAWLAPSFAEKPAVLQRTFWVFGLLKLLRSLRLYSLQAAGVVAPSSVGLLIVGRSGSGKSTLTIGLMRQGWRYLSDDAVLLRLQPHSTMRLLDRPSALRQLLAQSGPQLFDRPTMAPHLEVLKRLVQQSTSYELHAGLDPHHNPGALVHLLTEAEGAGQWREW